MTNSDRGSWAVHTVDGAEVRLRSGKVGMFSVDATAPVSGGEFVVDGSEARLSLRLDLAQLKTGNFLLQAAARSLVTRYDAGVLHYDGTGALHDAGWEVSGHAWAGEIDLVIGLHITDIGGADRPMSAVELAGSANVGTVDIPLPGMGKIEDFSFDVTARLALQPRSR